MSEVRWDQLLAVAEDVKKLLTREARGEPLTDDEHSEYEQSRGVLACEDATARRMPDFLRRCRTIDDFAAYKRANFSDALACESFVRDEFDDLLSMLEQSIRSDTPPFAQSIDAFLSPLVELLMLRGFAREVAILTAGTCSFNEHSYDNWDGGTWTWQLAIYLPGPLYATVSADEKQRKACEKTIGEIAGELLADERQHYIGGVKILMQKVARTDWRKRAETWLGGAGINNQGRVRSDNIASRRHDGLLFRSQPEIHVYQALKSSGVAFAPLPVFLRGGETYQRIEPDFVVMKQGGVMVIEVDGDTVHVETPAEADQRARIFKYARALVERVKASECDSPEKATACVGKLLQAFDDWRGR